MRLTASLARHHKRTGDLLEQEAELAIRLGDLLRSPFIRRLIETGRRNRSVLFEPPADEGSGY